MISVKDFRLTTLGLLSAFHKRLASGHDFKACRKPNGAAGLVAGHDFSHAVDAMEDYWALAREVVFSILPHFSASFRRAKKD
jgi:hypothetical protein